jgi:NADH dehydrogenase
MAASHTIVIAGGGFGGAYCAQALEKKLKGLPNEIYLLNPTNYFVFSPLLMEAGTGSLQPRHAVVSIRSFLKKTHFKMAQVTSIDFQDQEISYALVGDGKLNRISYDHLVMAIGSVTLLPNIKGLKEHGHELKSLADAVALRDRAIHMLEYADSTNDRALTKELLHFTVVGASFSGVEVAGELHEFVTHAAKLYPNITAADCQVTLIERSDRILTALDTELARYAAESMTKRGIHIHYNESVSEITANTVTLAGGTTLPCRTLIWCAGVAANPLAENIDLPMDKRGYILCESDLRVQGNKNIWAIGDCAVNPAPNGTPYPATAQHAVGQGLHLARNIARAIRHQEPLPCRLINKGTLAPLGCRVGVAKIFGIKFSGFIAWWLWRTVYLLKMPGWGRKFRIALDWTLDLFTRRDVVQLSLHTPERETK